MRSRGIAQSTIVLLILIVIALLILLPFFWKMGKVMMAYSQGGVCQASAAMAAVKVEKACVMEVTSPTTLRCPRRHVEIGPTKTTVTLEGKTEPLKVVVGGQSVSSYAAPNASVVNRVFADELLRCWEQFGAGEMALFSQADPSAWAHLAKAIIPGRTTEDNTACHVCSEIFFTGEVPESVLDGSKIKESNVRKFLADEVVPGKTYKYLDRLNNPRAFCDDSLSGVNDGKCWNALELYFRGTVDDEGMVSGQRMSPLKQIDASQGYAVLVVRKRFDACDKDNVDMSVFSYVVPVSDLQKTSNPPCNVFVS